MKHQIIVACFFCIALNLIQTSVIAKDSPTSAEQLRSDLESSLKTKDTNGVTSLFIWAGETNDWRESAGMREMMIRLQTDAMLKTDSIAVKLLPLPSDFQMVKTNEENGLRTKFNVNVTGIIDVESQNGSIEQLPYGNTGDFFYIAGITLEKIPGKPLSVNISAGPDPDSLTYTGSWVYVSGGDEIKVNISDTTNRFKICWGDYIKSCTVQRTSTNAGAPGFPNWFHYEIVEGGISVFQSQEMTNEDPVIYGKK